MDMGNSNKAVTNLRQAINNQDRTYAWLSRQTGIPYKRILGEIKHQTRPLSLDTTIQATEALSISLHSVLEECRK